MSPTRVRNAAAGAIGGLAGALAMNLFVRVVTALSSGRESPPASPGLDRQGRGMQPPQARHDSAEDAAVRTGVAIVEAATGTSVIRRGVRRRLGIAAHYAFGAGTGLVYGLLTTGLPTAARGRGLVYGTAVWALADQGLVLALGAKGRGQRAEVKGRGQRRGQRAEGKGRRQQSAGTFGRVIMAKSSGRRGREGRAPTSPAYRERDQGSHGPPNKPGQYEDDVPDATDTLGGGQGPGQGRGANPGEVHTPAPPRRPG